MQADIEDAVADHSVLVRPDVANLLLGEPDQLVITQGFENVRCADTEFQEAAQGAQDDAPAASARSRVLSLARDTSDALQSGDVSGQPPMCFSTRRVRNST